MAAEATLFLRGRRSLEEAPSWVLQIRGCPGATLCLIWWMTSSALNQRT
ncbi:hypothetical protein GDO78_010101 [Eleutherodactylus coqui]|uniref:Uncharacterized protein n=1 Tax=Eleutherodactylus coqui TaxID=57060 RepID=A0A8J6FDD2_ELECQ|nr:hypothetical protein GDO78_010101 [Eleutherodactylus coqui]